MNGFYTLMSPQTLRIPAGSDKQLITELLDGFAHGVCFTIQTDAPAGTVIWGAPAA